MLTAAAAASVDKHLQRYHADLQDAQQQLLVGACGGSMTQQQGQQCEQRGQDKCAGTRSSSGAAAAGGLTMQQLVAKLVKQDVHRVDERNIADNQG